MMMITMMMMAALMTTSIITGTVPVNDNLLQYLNRLQGQLFSGLIESNHRDKLCALWFLVLYDEMIDQPSITSRELDDCVNYKGMHVISTHHLSAGATDCSHCSCLKCLRSSLCVPCL
jgi:hypothetical protein